VESLLDLLLSVCITMVELLIFNYNVFLNFISIWSELVGYLKNGNQAFSGVLLFKVTLKKIVQILSRV